MKNKGDERVIGKLELGLGFGSDRFELAILDTAKDKGPRVRITLREGRLEVHNEFDVTQKSLTALENLARDVGMHFTNEAQKRIDQGVALAPWMNEEQS